MATLPLTVTAIEDIGSHLYGVTVAMVDGSTFHYVVPESLATIEGVSISAVALGQLLDATPQRVNAHHGKHRRYAPRTIT